MNKYNVAEMLTEIAAYEKGFRKQAFDKAAMIIMGMSDEKFNSIDPDHFDSVYGIGKSIAECISEYSKTGEMSRLNKHRENGDTKTQTYF